jgi:hypothetical protein
MKLKSKTAFLALGILAAAGFIIWPGCAWPPLPSTHHFVSDLRPVDFKFKKDSHPTRTEIFAKVGKPDEYISEHGVACYKLDRLTRDRIVLLFFVLPIDVYKDTDRLKVAFLQFDEQDRLQRAELKIVPDYKNGLRGEALQWSKQQDAERKLH